MAPLCGTKLKLRHITHIENSQLEIMHEGTGNTRKWSCKIWGFIQKFPDWPAWSENCKWYSSLPL